MRWLDVSREQYDRTPLGRGTWTLATAAMLFLSVHVHAQDTASTARTHTVKRGDTLWDIAATYIGDPFQWPEIYRLNRDVVENPHWIYPGETLRLPGGMAEAAEPETEGDEAPAPRGAGRTVFSPLPENAIASVDAREVRAPLATVRPGQILAAPYVDAPDAPRDAGRVLGSRDLPGIHVESERGRYRQFEEVTVVLPADAAGRVGERYVAVARDEPLEGLGRLLRPTAVLELVRAGVDGQAPIARVTAMFGDFRAEHRFVVLRGLQAPITEARPVTAGQGQEARIRWVVNEHVLPTIGSYVIIDAASDDGVRVGDELLIYEPRAEGTAGRPDTPEIAVGRAQIVRVTAQAATAVITRVIEPRIERGKWVRVTARMP